MNFEHLFSTSNRNRYERDETPRRDEDGGHKFEAIPLPAYAQCPPPAAPPPPPAQKRARNKKKEAAPEPLPTKAKPIESIIICPHCKRVLIFQTDTRPSFDELARAKKRLLSTHSCSPEGAA